MPPETSATPAGEQRIAILVRRERACPAHERARHEDRAEREVVDAFGRVVRGERGNLRGDGLRARGDEDRRGRARHRLRRAPDAREVGRRCRDGPWGARCRRLVDDRVRARGLIEVDRRVDEIPARLAVRVRDEGARGERITLRLAGSVVDREDGAMGIAVRELGGGREDGIEGRARGGRGSPRLNARPDHRAEGHDRDRRRGAGAGLHDPAQVLGPRAVRKDRLVGARAVEPLELHELLQRVVIGVPRGPPDEVSHAAVLAPAIDRDLGSFGAHAVDRAMLRP